MARGGSVKSDNDHHSSYTEPFHEKGFFHYLLLILVIGSIVISSLALKNVIDLKNTLGINTLNMDDFLAKLTSHDEMKNFIGTSPLNIIQINQDNIVNLQGQIAGLDLSYIGSFIVQYSDAIVIYDFDNDEIKGTVNFQQPQAQLPADFSAKMNAHTELQGLEAEQPTGGQIDAQSLATLKQQFPDVYANAKVGDFLLRYQTRLIIYDYNNDKIVNAVNLK